MKGPKGHDPLFPKLLFFSLLALRDLALFRNPQCEQPLFLLHAIFVKANGIWIYLYGYNVPPRAVKTFNYHHFDDTHKINV